MEIVELPPLKRGVEWPTMALAFAIYGLWLTATFFHRDLPWWALTALGAWIVTWQLNLQHETIHGHPTRNRRLNEAIGCWPLSLWLPYSIYRSTHLAHHRDENLHRSVRGPGKLLLDGLGMGRTGTGVARACLCTDDAPWAGRARPSLFDRGLHPRSLARRLARQTRRPRHRWAPSHVMRAGADLGDRDLPYAALGLSRLPSFIPAQAWRWCAPSPSIAPCPRRSGRTAIVENAWILGPLFLFNNLHAVHHLRHRLPWYQIPKFYRLNRAALIKRNGGLVYRGYLDVARRYLWRPHDSPFIQAGTGGPA